MDAADREFIARVIQAAGVTQPAPPPAPADLDKAVAAATAAIRRLRASVAKGV